MSGGGFGPTKATAGGVRGWLSDAQSSGGRFSRSVPLNSVQSGCTRHANIVGKRRRKSRTGAQLFRTIELSRLTTQLPVEGLVSSAISVSYEKIMSDVSSPYYALVCFFHRRRSSPHGSTRQRGRSDGQTSAFAWWDRCRSVQGATRSQQSAPPTTPSPPPPPMLTTRPTPPLLLAPSWMSATTRGVAGSTARTTSASSSWIRSSSAHLRPTQVP